LPPLFNRGQLDQLVLDIELVLISVVQGVALSTLAIGGLVRRLAGRFTPTSSRTSGWRCASSCRRLLTGCIGPG